MPDPKTLSAGAYDKKMGELEKGIKTPKKKKRRIPNAKRVPAMKFKPKDLIEKKPISISSALNREEEKGSGVTKPEAALRNAVAANQFPKKKYT